MQTNTVFRDGQFSRRLFARRTGLIMPPPSPRQRVRRNGAAGVCHREHAVARVRRSDAAASGAALYGVSSRGVECTAEQVLRLTSYSPCA